MRIELNKHVVIDSEICHGKPTFKGTRIMVWQILEMLEAGMSFSKIIEDFPDLTKEHIKAALRYAADLTRGRNNVVFRIPAET